MSLFPTLNVEESPSASPSRRKLVVFSGGSAANSLVDVFNEVMEKHSCSLTYVIPISDNGGSSSELIRVFGGPGIGDIRSRLVRLIPPTHAAIRTLFNHRLPSSPDLAQSEFLTLLLGTSPLWLPIPTAQALLIRSILSHLHLEILKRARPPTSTFNFQSASIGNLFLTGARLFSGSFESAIYLLAIMGGVDESRTAVLPAIISNFTHHISAGLANGSTITGQNAISHPSEPTALNTPNPPTPHPEPSQEEQEPEDANPPSTLPTLRGASIAFSKTPEASPPLPARIERIWYISPYGHEMRPQPNPRVLAALAAAEAVIYSIGSLYTSLVPALILRGVGEAIAKTPRFKILLLNGCLDRETEGFRAEDFVQAVVRAGEESRGVFGGGGEVGTVRRYVTHLIHLEGEGVPVVEREVLARWGVECVRLYGRKGEDGGMRYDGKALGQALGAILGKREPGVRSRRNTLEG
ncbi:MAG: hypothetical protein Q9195_003479 [Heterodermia aff. obscurata]